MNYLNEYNHKKQVNSLLKADILSQTVNFATRIQNSSSTAIDNIFIDSTRLSSSCTSPLVNSLSGHDTQFLTVNNILTVGYLISLKQKTRKINNEIIAQFQD
jgi:hypothetical protein